MSYPTCSGISCSADCADRDPCLRKDDVKSKSKDDVKSKSKDDVKSKSNDDSTKAQSGRSMIEMLGVLAIIGVLSVGGIAGYSKAMMKFKINKTVDQISQIVGNIRTLYASQKSYGGFWCSTSSTTDCNIFKKAHVVPDEMWNSDGKIENVFGSEIHLNGAQSKKSGDSNKAFTISLFGLPEEACMELATYDWGSGSSSGLIAIGAGDASAANLGCQGVNSGASSYACPNGTTLSVPMSVAVAVNVCNSASDSYLIWKFY